jgi:hypothetical protein
MSTSPSRSESVPDPRAGAEPPKRYPDLRAPATAVGPRTDVIETPVELVIRGPARSADEHAIWAVLARVLQWVTDTHGTELPWFSRALRQIYVDRNLPARPAPQALLPGMLLARCRILTARIRVNGVAFEYAGPTDDPVDVDLLLEADDADWARARTVNPAGQISVTQLFKATCLAGEIPIDRFTVHPNAPSSQPDWTTQFPFLSGAARKALSSSGLMLDATAVFPWSDPARPISRARYLVEIRLPKGADATPPLVVLPDLERLDDAPYRQAKADYVAAFALLAQQLSPINRPPASEAPRTLLSWSSLEPTNPSFLPGFYWDVRLPDGATTPVNTFEIEPGAWRLALFDQPLRVQGVSPRGVLSASVALSVTAPDAKDRTKLVVTAAPVPGNTVASGPPPGTLAYVATAVPRGSGAFSETIDIRNVDTAYQTVAVAEKLREIAGLPEPSLDAAEAPSSLNLLLGSTPPFSASDGKVRPSFLYGAVPLLDGWAQLPFVNATEQILVDVLQKARPGAAGSISLFQGAAVFGIDRPELFNAGLGLPAWRVAVLDAVDFHGEWALAAGKLTGINLTLTGLEMDVEGLFWLATAAPTAQDALPALDDWLRVIQSVSLRTPDPAGLYPPPFLVRFNKLSFSEGPSFQTAGYSTADLTEIDYSYTANGALLDTGSGPKPTVYERLVGPEGPFELSELVANVPLVWRRHAKVPLIQSLPMTQSLTPPSYPSASRQLFPFALAMDGKSPTAGLAQPGDWRFASESALNWPRLTSGAQAATKRADMDGLVLASLGLPGLVFDPNAAEALFVVASTDSPDRIMPAQYRHEVALVDEVNALASLPKDEQPLADGQSPPQPPPGLQRADYQAFWEHLAQLAFSARADARDALAAAGGKTFVQGLIEPFLWQATATLGSAPYPGRISLADGASGRPIMWNGSTSDALRGIEGTFVRAAAAGQIVLAPADAAEFTVVGEAMSAVLDTTGRLRDQRGLYREATQIMAAAATTWLKTRVVLADDVDAVGAPVLPVILWTMKSPLALSGASASPWDFWFRDLPAVDHGTTSTFDRAASRSIQRRAENNPAALSRTLNHLNGYEWRMGQRGAAPLSLGPLWFYPLSLESAVFDSTGGLTFSVIGRLHLPYSGVAPKTSDEPVNRSNAVKLTFVAGKLDAVEIAALDLDDAALGASSPAAAPAPVNEWPLGDPDAGGDAPDPPILRWGQIALSGDKASLVLTGANVVYVRHGVTWTLPAANVTIRLSGTGDPVAWDFKPDDGAAVSIVSASLAFDFTPGASPSGHSLTVNWRFQWGAPDQLRLRAEYAELVLPQNPPPSPAAPSAKLLVLDQTFDLISDMAVPPNLDGGAVQVQWKAMLPGPLKPVAPGSPGQTLQVLPGFHLSPVPKRASRGFALLSFALEPKANDMPVVDRPGGGTMEALFGCDWGVPLQAALAAGSADQLERVFGSSSGKIDADYTAVFQARVAGAPAAAPHEWSVKLLLNGFLEVKNLVSSPRDLVWPTEGDNRMTLPAARPAGTKDLPAFSHMRHTARVLFNQHIVPADAVVPAAASKSIFLSLSPSAPWITQAVVEHQLVVVELDGSDAAPVIKATDRECRMTLSQEVRFCSPSVFRSMLDELAQRDTTEPGFPLAGQTTQDQSPLILLRALPDEARGYLSRPMLGRLTRNTNKVADLRDEDTMLVEASASALVRTAIDPDAGLAASDLSYLSTGTTRAHLSALRDFQSITDDDREAPSSWVLASLAFLGRTQPQPLDEVDTTAAAAGPAKVAAAKKPHNLRVDPVLQLVRGRGSAAVPLDGLALRLANWQDKKAATIGLAEFDLARHRKFGRLDPASLRESWFRLSVPPSSLQPAPASAGSSSSSLPPGSAGPFPLPPVLAEPLTDEPRSLGRPEMLARLMDPRRLALPPDQAFVPSGVGPRPPAPLQWSPDSLYLLDFAGSNEPPDRPGKSAALLAEYSFSVALAQIAQARLVPFFSPVVTAGGSGYTTPPTVTITSSDGRGSGATAAATVVGGAVTAVTITCPGAGYVQPPLVSFGGPGTGAAATLKPALVRRPAASVLPARLSFPSSVAKVQVTSGGAGYASAPTVTIKSVDSGSGATAFATVSGGAVTAVTITDPGAGYTRAPLVEFDPPDKGAAATAVLAFANVQPVSTTVSPYLGFELGETQDADALDWVLAVGELVCFDLTRASATSVATQVWFPPTLVGTPDDVIAGWGAEMQARVAADSPVAVIRLREVRALPPSTGKSPAPDAAFAVVVLYRFLAASAIAAPPLPARRAKSLRARPERLRFPQGQYGGAVLPPGALAHFELAPPQIDGVQPIRMDNRLDAGGKPLWPWGLAALRLHINQFDAMASCAGPPLVKDDSAGPQARAARLGRLWWESLAHNVQYAVPEDAGERKVLPALFRARAMPGLLPAWPSAPLPTAEDIQAALEPPGEPAPDETLKFTAWQPILPGGHTVLLAGARPGAPFAMRQFLQTQDIQRAAPGQPIEYRSLVSGSLPVMHRMPRPVLLPANDRARPEIALQTWASAFDPTSTASAQPSPIDSAYLGSVTGARGLDLVLGPLVSGGGTTIKGGGIPLGLTGDDANGTWDLALHFHADGHGNSVDAWFPAPAATAVLIDQADVSKLFTFSKTGFTPDATSVPDVGVLDFMADNPVDLKKWLLSKAHGDAAFVRVIAGMDSAQIKNFRQTLTFAARIIQDQGTAALPYEPRFALFEDPEYSRRLASEPERASAIVSVPGAGNVSATVTLAVDRGEYNATGLIHYLFTLEPLDRLPPGTATGGKLQFTRISPAGGAEDLGKPPFNLKPVSLAVNSLADLTVDPTFQDLLRLNNVLLLHDRPPLTPGDSLVLSLTLDLQPAAPTPPPAVTLTVPVVKDPVIPAPQAGFALLRKNPDRSVECARFAFSPAATRIELVDPDDILKDSVRRRATFQWRDTVRVPTDGIYVYAIQKVTTGGSTHFPDVQTPAPEKPFVGKTVSIKAANNGYVSAANEGRSPLFTEPAIPKQWELFDVVAAGGGHVALWARANGKYLTAKDRLTPLIADADAAAGPGVLFDIEALGASRFALRSVENGKYVRAGKERTSPLIADWDTAGPSEGFSLEIVRLTVNGHFVNKRVTMTAEVNGKYVYAEDEGKRPLIAHSTIPKQWELFDVVAAGGGHVALQACANSRLVTTKNGLAPLIADAKDAAGPGVLFDIEALDAGAKRYALRAVGHGRYVCADNGGNSPLIANRDTAGRWEWFILEIA